MGTLQEVEWVTCIAHRKDVITLDELPQPAPAIGRVGRILYVARWLIIAGVLVESRLQFTSAKLNRHEIVIAAICMAALTLAVRFLPKAWTSHTAPLVTLIADALFVTTVVFYSDGLQSPFYPLFYVTVITSAVHFGSAGAVLCAAIISVLLLGIEFHEPRGALSEALVKDDVLRTFPYLFTIALITGALRDRVRVLADTEATLRAEQARVAREMELARSVQQAQLAADIPTIDGAEVAVLHKPAREVGGDAYDFCPVYRDRVGVVVSDVAGKGVPAALLLASAKYAWREHCHDDPAQTMHEVNDRLLAMTTEDAFMVMIYGVLDIPKREFTYVNAGQMPPIVVRPNGETTCHEGADMPAGISGAATYLNRAISLQPGDTLALYSDGLTDALGEHDAGIRELTECLAELSRVEFSRWPEELLRRIENPRHVDDVTAVLVRVR